MLIYGVQNFSLLTIQYDCLSKCLILTADYVKTILNDLIGFSNEKYDFNIMCTCLYVSDLY